MKLSFDPQLMMSQASSPGSLEKDKAPKNTEGLRRACQDFEAVMLKAMFKSMRTAVPDGGLIEKGTSDEIFNDLMDQEVATQMARNEGIGIGDMLFRQLQKLDSGK